ncbi:MULTISPECIES: hypothetical protein [unclassified Rhizobium]|uniref:hypothetical protein n=1 Tax=unclassified Rhizobium TaxID=2613769 RepID=UPI001ADCD975|nr:MULTISPECIES: hypothetical protein [unclassified Rhizobium]MBO9099644.1 hypothetical protein [Rhizobium sp. L58/93]QXZ86887.1 hypothetical protein J5287_19990 [Rhizobium sp. K1/93]QXZ93080.1 hypothetical protein J5280_20905 [Rhizobium sp. K15/93]
MALDAAGMSAEGFSHVRVIVGMVLGLSLARLVNGLTRFVQHPGSIKIYPIHLGWVVFLLITIIHFWWYEFNLRLVTIWTFPIYFFLIVYAMLYAALTALLFPDQMSEYSGYEQYFEARKRWFYGVFALTFIIDLGDSLIKGSDYFAALGTEYLFRQSIFAFCAVAAMFVPGKGFQALFLIVGTLYQISWILRVYDLL